MSETINPILVEKEAVASLHFPQLEVLTDLDEIQRRRTALERATSLGNLERGKASIIFEDDQGVKKVETTIWATTENSIILKQGVTIPINRILRVI